MKSQIYSMLTGVLLGAALFTGGTTYAAEAVASPSWHTFYVDDTQVAMEAYNINGSNFVKIRDIGKAVGFNVYWQDGVRIDTDAPYTGVAPVREEPTSQPDDTAPQPEAQTPQAVDTESARLEIIQRTNALRAEQNGSTLRTNALLMEAAQVRAEEMAASGTYSHTRPDGRKFYTVVDCPYLAENIHQIADWQLKDTSLPEFAVKEWAESPGHLKP